MSYNIKNRTKRPIVCPLKDNIQTLRLVPGQELPFDIAQKTPLIDRYLEEGYLVLTEIVKDSKKRKEEE